MSFDPSQKSPIGITLVIVTIAGLFAAMFLGSFVAKSDYLKIGFIVLATIALVLSLALKEKVWLLIPVCWLLTGRLAILPFSLSYRDLAIIGAFVVFMTLWALKLVRQRGTTGWMEVILAINIVYLISVFVRNPVGVAAFETEMVGGRPYFSIILSLLAFFVLRYVRLSEKQARHFPMYFVIPAIFTGLISTISYLAPSTVPVLMMVYQSGIELGTYMTEQGITGASEIGRISGLMFLARIGSTAMCSYYRPLTLFSPAYPLRFFLFLCVVAIILLSGFRTAVIFAGAMFVLGSIFRKSYADTLKVAPLGAILLMALVLGQGQFFNLPTVMQRALSFLPGDWDSAAVQSAEESSQWRFEMWRNVWETDTYIRNKILGDGIGFRISDYKLIAGPSGMALSNTQEAFSIMGVYHSGPLSAIRCVGIVGFLLFLLWIIFLAVCSAKLINRSRGSPYFVAALFVGMPLIYQPFNYIFIFGGYDGDLPESIVMAAFLKLIDVSLKQWAAQEPKRTQQSISDLKSIAAGHATPLPVMSNG